MRVLCLGLDGADYDLTSELLAQGKLPTLARVASGGAFGPLRSTIPALTPAAWSSFLTGLNPGRHGILNFSSNPNRSVERIESAASRAGTPLWRTLGAAGIRSAFVTVPFTYPAEAMDGLVVTGYGGPDRPEIVPAAARERILAAYPDFVTAHHPMAERWWEDFEGFTRKLIAHVDEVAGVCKLAFELEPDLGLLCVDFMSADHAGHLGYHRLDPEHPAHDPAQQGDELVQVYEAVDRACGELIEAAEAAYGEEPTVVVLSDHGMKPIYWRFHLNRWLEQEGFLRYRTRSLQPLKRTRLDWFARADQRAVRTRRGYGRALDRIPFLPRPAAERAFADIDFGSTRAYGFGAGGQLYLGEASGARGDRAVEEELVAALRSVAHPETGEPAFDVRRKEELFHGPYADKAPDLVVLPHDERIHVDAKRHAGFDVFLRHETLDPTISYGYSGHHGITGILAASGPGVRFGEVPEDAEITQMAPTLLRLFGLEPEGLDAGPVESILEEGGTRRVAVGGAAGARAESVYSDEEESALLERLRDLGYE